MVKLVILFRRPSDPDSWMTHFMNHHRPLLGTLPGLAELEVSLPFDVVPLAGRRPDRRGAPYLMAELYFSDRAAFDAAMVSDQGRAAIEDLQEWAGRDASLFLAEADRRTG